MPKGKQSRSRGHGQSYQKQLYTRQPQDEPLRYNETEYEDDSSKSKDLVGAITLSTGLYMWEFGQNDPKRDSGSKMVRMGVAGVLKVGGSSFAGLVLSSESRIFASAADAEIVRRFGIAGVNCSWNRIDEIPMSRLGKPYNHRILPYLLAANSLNYGKALKLNTAEATAACLYIVGLEADARALMSLFPFGEEFLRLNYAALEAYAACERSEDVERVSRQYEDAIDNKKREKCERLEKERVEQVLAGNIGGYMDDMDLPPQSSDEEFDEEAFGDCYGDLEIGDGECRTNFDVVNTELNEDEHNQKIDSGDESTEKANSIVNEEAIIEEFKTKDDVAVATRELMEPDARAIELSTVSEIATALTDTKLEDDTATDSSAFADAKTASKVSTVDDMTDTVFGTFTEVSIPLAVADGDCTFSEIATASYETTSHSSPIKSSEI